MLFQQLRHYQKVVNVSYWYKKYVCIDACSVTCTELLVGQAGKNSEQLKRNKRSVLRRQRYKSKYKKVGVLPIRIV